ncbi:MAG TPA: hypothetical protein VGR01_00450 [Burkholderiales bacterium]|jgi:hypothetical protein|nr:hypothetical protein [Burkholderiales bacterium]
MFRKNILSAAVAAALVVPASAFAADDAEIGKIREEIKQLKDGYENRIRSLEDRLREAQSTGPGTAAMPAVSAPTPAYMSKAVNMQSAFNPAISLILDGKYQNLERDPETYQIGGFIPGGEEIGPGGRSFNLGESELTVSANIDPYFSGVFVAAVTPENEVEIEEGYFQNSGFIPGTTFKFGRFLSGFGYLNEIHAHAWDFVDAPLVHQAFFGGQLKEEGLQARWLAPTPVFLEFGLETGRGANFPGSERNKNGSNSGEVFFHLGDDVGTSNSYRFGASYRKTTAVARRYEDADSLGNPVFNAFDGDSKMWGVDFVWKWAPNGDSTSRNFKFQTEYLHRDEDGSLTFDADEEATGPLTDTYKSKQSGWYVQGAYQFMPRWRIGLRYEELDRGTMDIGGTLTAATFPLLEENDPKRTTAMIDFSPSEFSRFRLQFARDEARFSESDNQVFLQYIMSLGAHGAHKF